MNEERKKDDKFYGAKSTLAVLKNRPNDITKIFVRKGEEGRFKDFLSMAASLRIPYNLVSSEELQKISQTEHNEGVCLYAKRKNFVATNKLISSANSKTPLLILDAITNPHNIGALLRTACFFGITSVLILTKERLSLSGALARVSEGGTETLNIGIEQDYIKTTELLAHDDFEVIVTETEESTLTRNFKKLLDSKKISDIKIAIVLGSERDGVSDTLRMVAKNALYIEGYSALQSLNVSVACGIVLDRIVNGQK